MEQAQEAKRAVLEWYARDESKEYIYYLALLLWISLHTVNVAVLAHIASRPDNTVPFLAFVLLWLFPTLLATTYAMLNSLRLWGLVQCRRAQALQGAQLEINQTDVL